jgi:hypothetical protein
MTLDRLRASLAGALCALAALLLAPSVTQHDAVSAQAAVWTREALDGREVRALAASSDGQSIAALVAGERDQMPLWLRSGGRWSSSNLSLPRFILVVAGHPDGWLLGTGRDLADQPGLFAAGASDGPRRIYDAQAIGALAVSAEGGAILAAAAPWADRDATPEIVRRDPTSGGWQVALRGTLICGAGPSFFRQIVVAPSLPRRVFAVEWCSNPAFRQALVWRSDDGGLTWQSLPRPALAPLPFALAVEPTNEQRLYLAPFGMDTEGIERSSDGGVSWTAEGDDTPGLTGLRTLQVDRRSPRRLLAGTSRNGVFLSEDRGETWQPLSGLEGIRVWALLVDEAAGQLLAATADGIWRAALP